MVAPSVAVLDRAQPDELVNAFLKHILLRSTEPGTKLNSPPRRQVPPQTPATTAGIRSYFGGPIVR
ncbi:hypothetical protein ACN6LC_003723 [Streptomyces violaceoruber]